MTAKDIVGLMRETDESFAGMVFFQLRDDWLHVFNAILEPLARVNITETEQVEETVKCPDCNKNMRFLRRVNEWHHLKTMKRHAAAEFVCDNEECLAKEKEGMIEMASQDGGSE